MFIIIEGPDAAGKSSMLAELHRHLTVTRGTKDVHSFHKGRPLEETRELVLSEYVLSIDELVTSGECVVSDRWHWGEHTYAPLKRPHTDTDGYGLLGRAGWRWTELFLLSRGAGVWVLDQPLDVLRERLSQRGDDYINESELAAIAERYESGIRVAPSFVERLRPRPDDIRDLRRIAKAVVDHAAFGLGQSARLRYSFPEYIGPIVPQALLLSDARRSTEPAGPLTRLPLIPLVGSAGEFLLSGLSERFWPRVGLIAMNTDQGASEDRLRGLWSTLGYPPIIALGEDARLFAARAGTGTSVVGSVMHPRSAQHLPSAGAVGSDEYAQVSQRYGMSIEALVRVHEDMRREERLKRV